MPPTLIAKPKRIPAAGNKPKLIDEYVGSVTSDTSAVSVASMRSPGGWQEPGQTPEFEEYRAEYIAVCHPAFSMETVHRDE